MTSLRTPPRLLRSLLKLALLSALCLLALPASAQDSGIASAKSVFGANSYLSDGATALMLGNYKRGVELTRLGMAEVISTAERAASLSNLCAGYVGLREYDVAVVYCNRSLEITASNWRALQNRAAAYAGLGDFKRALVDIEKGLALNPDSDQLKLTLAIVREQERRFSRPRAARS